VARTSKRGDSGNASVSLGHHPPPRPSHHTSHYNDEGEDDHEVLERYPPIECSSHMAIRYSKKTKQGTVNGNREAPLYVGSKQYRYPHFWSLFHFHWYCFIYLDKKRPVMETQWVNWDWMAARRHSTFDQIKATCDKLEMTKLMCFKYSWNKEIICQFYTTLYFDDDG
jgi:hypothetical protein